MMHYYVTQILHVPYLFDQTPWPLHVYLFHHKILFGFYPRAATILEWHLLNSEVPVKLFVKIRALGNASFIRLTKNLDVLT